MAARARAQQPAMPVVGFLNTASPEPFAHLIAAFSLGLNEAGFVEGTNLEIEYRWGAGHYDRMPALAADLVRRQVNVLAAFSPPAALAAKAATASIPIVITSGDDPVKLGLIASLARPGGNITGVSLFTVALGGKRHELLRKFMPAATAIGVLINPESGNAQPDIEDARRAASILGWQIQIVTATSEQEFDSAFEALVNHRVSALVIGNDQFFASRRDYIVALAKRHVLTHNLSVTRLCRRRWLDELRTQHFGSLPTGWCLCWSGPQRREASRTSGRTTDQVRIRDQPQDRAFPRA